MPLKKNRIKKHYKTSFFWLVLFIFCCCQPSRQKKEVFVEEFFFNDSDTLYIATMHGSTSYFITPNRSEVGYDFEMAENLSLYLEKNLHTTIAKNETELIQLLRDNKVDLIACNLPEISELKKEFRYIVPNEDKYMILIQKRGVNAIFNVAELAGKTIHVVSNSIYHRRLQNLNEEIGGGINIVELPDTLNTDDLIIKLVQNEIDYTLAYYPTGKIYSNYFKQLNTRMKIGFEQKNGWLINKKNIPLIEAIETWEQLPETKRVKSLLTRKYNNNNPFLTKNIYPLQNNAISPFDAVFKKYAAEIDWDWRMLAALAFHESTFDSTKVSRVGAAGIMQLMPATAEKLGLSEDSLFFAEKNIEAGARYLKQLERSFQKVKEKEERKKFVIGAYNSGLAHVFDAMTLTERYGKNPYLWFDNVEYFLLRKSLPEFQNDSIVKYGRNRGDETVNFVRNVLTTYESYLHK